MSSRKFMPELEEVPLERLVVSKLPLCIGRDSFAKQDETLPR